MIRIEGTRVDLYTLPGTVGLQVGRDVDELTVADARRLATQLLRAANEAETKAAAAEVPAELAEPKSVAELASDKARTQARAAFALPRNAPVADPIALALVDEQEQHRQELADRDVLIEQIDAAVTMAETDRRRLTAVRLLLNQWKRRAEASRDEADHEDGAQ